MYRGRPPPRGGYPPPFEGRGPPPGPRPYLVPGYREDRGRPRAPYHAGYHDHGPPESYRRSPPRRRYPSPGSGSHRGGEYWTGAPPRERSPSPRGPVPLDHNLVITVGNELTGPSGPAPSRHHDRDYPPRPEHERGRSRPRSRSPDRSRAKSLGRSKSQVRSKSRPRSPSRSPDRSRARGRSKSRSPDRSRAKSRGRSKSRSPDRSRAKSRGRSKSWGRSKSRSPDRSRARSRGRSKSRPRSRSRSRGRSRGRSGSKAASHVRNKSRQRSRSASSSSSSSSSCSSDSDRESKREFRELDTARRRKELEEMLSLPTKSILKRRNDSEDSPTLRSTESPRGPEGTHISRVADQLLQAVKGMEPHMVAHMLSELRSDPQMAQRAGLDAEIKEILNLLGGPAGAMAQEKTADDIDDEEKFLYGDSEEPKPAPAPELVQHHGLDLYGDLTEEALYGDYPPPKAIIGQTYGLPPGASPHLQAPPTLGEGDMRYASQPTISPDQNIRVQVPNPAYPPGTEPLEEGERQALEEYEKIQDLLKTIGLDLGVGEISKMAARTKERLHGSKPPPKTPTRRRYSSGSSDGSRRSRGRRRRSPSGSSSSSSRSRSRERGGSWSSDDDRRKSLALPKLHKARDVKEMKPERSDAAPPPHKEPLLQTPDPNTHTPHPGVPIPTYPPSQVHGIMPPNFPPPGYGQYGNYLPYMHQQWPPMYPPPNISLPPPTSPEDFPPSLPYKQPYTKPALELGAKGPRSSVQDGEKGKVSSHDRRVSEEQNNESQKQKVLEEREKLKQERELRMKKKEYLMKELERLRKQQGELLRKKRREKDGHKDPLLQEISHLQEEVMTQISNLRKEHEAAEKKRNEIDKVALILGLNPSDRPRRTVKAAADEEDEPSPPEKKKRELERSPDGRQAAGSFTIKQTSAALSSLRASPDKPPVTGHAPPPPPFEYYDAGNHWCKNCNVTSGSMFDFFTHLHSKTHRKTLDPYDRPWASTPSKTAKNTLSEEKLTKPAKGSEFLLPVRGFFCLLCKEFYGDAICAEEHVITHSHNEKYKKQMYENPMYEQRRNLDRQAGLALETSGKKRKHEDDEKSNKDKEEKSKHKKEKKDKEKKKEDSDTVYKEDKSRVKKEEEEDKLKPTKKEEDFKDAKGLEVERPSYSKKDEDEKSKFSKKDDKYRHSREEEERGKYSRRDEDDRYKYSREEECRYRYRREEDDRYDDRSKYGQRDDEDKYKHGKYPDYRSKYDRERDEGKPKAEKEAFKRLEPGKPVVSKPEPPPKPYDPPKILCGPSPAMRAKLRKQSLETGKPVPVATTASFGKFTWKKRENVLAKEAEKVAAEFIKEDEEAVKQNPVSVEDSFAKSMAVAKEIAQKLGGPTMPPPWVSNGANRGRIRPNLPAPAAVLRKTAMMGKPAPLNTFLSIRPQNTTLLGSPPKDELAKPPISYPGPFEDMRAPMAGIPEPFKATLPPPAFEVKPVPSVSKSAPFEVKPAPPVSKPAPFEVKPVPPVSKPAPFEVNPAPPVSKPTPIEARPVLSDAKSASCEAKPVPSGITPSTAKPAQPTMIKIVSDVAAPGVPESEQTRTVFVKPPPFMNLGDGAQKSEKHKSHLAAAKAQDLFDIFYSNMGQSGASSITKPPTDARADESSTNKSKPSTPQTPKPQPQCQLLAQSQPPAAADTSTQLDSNNSSTSPQSQSESDIQIASVWSLQPTPAQSHEVAPSETNPRTTQQKLNPLAQSEAPSVPQNQSEAPSVPQNQSEAPSVPQNQSEAPSVPQNQSEAQRSPQTQSSSPKFESKIAQHTEPSKLEPTPQTLSPQIQTEPQAEPQPDQGSQPHSHPDTHPDTAPEPEPKPGPKTRGKATPTKRTPLAPRPARQTRSQTRYQTRRQQQSQPEPEPELASGDSDSAASDQKGLDTSDPGSEMHAEEGVPSEGDRQMMAITPETLGLPSDMTSLDFEYDFNFE